MKKVIVTGGAGFIGSHLVEELVNKGYAVTVIDNLFTGKKEHLKNVGEKIEFIEGDIRDIDLLKKHFVGVDTVFHQAALRSVPASVKEPVPYYDVNIIGTHNVLEAARVCGVRRIVFASSSSVYGDLIELPQKEDKTGNRLSPYAISKKTGEDLCIYFYKTYGLETVSLRYFNVFGPKQDPHSQYSAVIPLFITSLINNQQPTIFGDGEQTRDFTHVNNVVQANILAMNAEKAVGQAINVANGERISVNKLFNSIKKILNKTIEPIYTAERQGDVKHTLADNKLAQELLKYRNFVSFEEGMKETITWYTQHSQGL